MHIVIHRVNTIPALRALDARFGVEVDIRADGSTLVMNHDPFRGGEKFADYVAEYRHGLLVLDIKETGIEKEVLRLVSERGIRDAFLLDVEFPYLYRAAAEGERRVAVRYSEVESIETVEHFAGRVDWVWVDTLTRLPLDAGVVARLRRFRTCLVCPERWGRPQDIEPYGRQMRELGFTPDAVMTSLACAPAWERLAAPQRQANGRPTMRSV
jgi:hypothetical protein